MHSFCITGGTAEDQTIEEQTLMRTWGVFPFDVHRITLTEEKHTIGIDDIRLLTHNLSLAPRQSPVMVGIIEHAELMTIEAQNALLKTLEEPSPKVRIILKSQQTTMLLPTVVSRCQMIVCTNAPKLNSEEKGKIAKILADAQTASPGAICQMIDQLVEHKEEGGAFLSSLLYYEFEQLVQSIDNPNQSLKQAHLIRTVITAQSQLSANVNTALVLDHLFFTSLACQAINRSVQWMK